MSGPRILVPVDFSDRSRRALEYTAVLARALRAEVTVLHAWDCPAFARDLPANTAQASSLADLLLESMRRELDAFISSVLPSSDLTLVPVLTAASPAQAILEAARQRAHEFIVMSTRGRGPIASALLGSVARRVMEHSVIPVLLVPDREARAR